MGCVRDIFEKFGNDIAIIQGDTGFTVSYAELHRMVSIKANEILALSEKTLVFLYPLSGAIDSIVLYLSCLELGYPVCLVEPRVAFLPAIAKVYSPGLILLPKNVVDEVAALLPMYHEHRISGDYSALRSFDAVTKEELHPQLRLLLLTSGSTGSPKFVRLQWANIASNSTAIGAYLGIKSGERCMQSLPMHYSYGLSLINSHLFAGATVVLTEHSFMRPEFWRVVTDFSCTSFAGVPYMYETLYRLRFDPAIHSTITTFTQAGGGLKRELLEHFHQRIESSGQKFVVMYGQTEATARISYVPSHMLGEKLGSIGIPIPGGALSIESSDGFAELVYRGPNVMMGYSENRASLARGDELGGVLRTGDIGAVDGDGYFSIVGRRKRITKLFGQRVNLQDVECEAERITSCPVAVIAVDGEVQLFIAGDPVDANRLSEKEVQKQVAHFLQVPPKVVKVVSISHMPMTLAGKRDYQALAKEHA